MELELKGRQLRSERREQKGMGPEESGGGRREWVEIGEGAERRRQLVGSKLEGIEGAPGGGVGSGAEAA